MTITDSFLSNAGWLFFTAWSIILGAISVAAFGRDLLPSKLDLDPGPQTLTSDSIRKSRPGER